MMFIVSSALLLERRAVAFGLAALRLRGAVRFFAMVRSLETRARATPADASPTGYARSRWRAPSPRQPNLRRTSRRMQHARSATAAHNAPHEMRDSAELGNGLRLSLEVGFSRLPQL